jgi:hypothetical protein
MRLENVDHQKGDLVLVLVVELVQAGNLPPEQRSSIAAKDQNHGLPRIQVRQPNSSRLIDFLELEIGSHVSHSEISGARLAPQRFKGREKKNGWSRHMGHGSAKLLGRPVHRPPEECDKSQIGDAEAC